AELHLEPARGARQLLLPLDDVHRHADRPRVVRDGALHRLADPPGRVGRELVAAAPVELLDRAVEAERSLLDEIEERNAEAAVALRDRHDETQVRLDHAPLLGRLDQDAGALGFKQVVELVLRQVRDSVLSPTARGATAVLRTLGAFSWACQGELCASRNGWCRAGIPSFVRGHTAVWG